MGRYEKTKDLPEADFSHLTGVKPQTFEKMLEILKRALAKKEERGGRPNKLCIFVWKYGI